jgi:glycosyltransferase involved in cell wall biosynthesis
MDKKNILLIGSYPPPYGGISVHIKRLSNYIISKDDNCTILHTGKRISRKNLNIRIIRIFDLRKLYGINKTNLIVHFHVSALRNIFSIYLLTMFYNRQKKIITIHSGSFTNNFNRKSKFVKYLLSSILSHFDNIIALHKIQKQILHKDLLIELDKIFVIPAYIQPTATQKGLDKSQISLISNTKKVKIVTSGYIQEFYGYEMVIDFLEDNRKYIGFFVFYGSPDEKYKERIIDRIEKIDNIHYFVDLTPEQFNWIQKNSDIYVRNTDRDGDSVAIREAGYWGKKVCASKSSFRPDGTALFTFNVREEFESAINKVLEEENAGIIESGNSNAEDIYELYNL